MRTRVLPRGGKINGCDWLVYCVKLYLSILAFRCRALPWDPNIGDEAGEMDSFVKYLIMRLRNSLVEKSGHYALEPGPLPEVRNGVTNCI